jgi:hypothetical protein
MFSIWSTKLWDKTGKATSKTRVEIALRHYVDGGMNTQNVRWQASGGSARWVDARPYVH